MATTLILTTSCAPIKRSTDSSSHNGGSGATATDHTSFSSSTVRSDYFSGGANNVKNTACFTTGHNKADAVIDAAANSDNDNSCHHDSSSIVDYRGNKPESQQQHQQRRRRGIEFLDKLQALPLQCDITIIPRASHPNDDDIIIPHDNSNANNNSRREIMTTKPIRITNQQFHSCGIDNIVRLAGSVIPTMSPSGKADMTNDFILSLANCGVRIGSMNEEEENEVEMIKFPIMAVPSSFSFPSSSKDDDDTGLLLRDYSYSGGGGGKHHHHVEEVAISFDFSIAVDMYQQRLDDNGVDAAAAALDHNKHHRVNNNQSSWNEDDGNVWNNGMTAEEVPTSTTFTNTIKTLEINSIVSTLEEESQFIKKTLVVLGSFGVGLLMCMVWTIYKLERARRLARRKRRSISGSSRVVKKVFVDVPYEIIGTTTAKSRGGVTSLRSNPSSLRSHGKSHHFPEEISPIRSSSVSLNEAEGVEKADRLTAAAAAAVVAATASNNSRKGMHETLHLITPQDPQEVDIGDVGSNSNEGREQSSSSPRHWYEDFLSPRGCSKKAPRNRSETLFSENEGVARSLFCSSSSSSNKVSSHESMDNEASFSFNISSKGGAVSSALNAPKKKKVLVTPIERSSFSPPPSDVSLLKLSRDIESSKSPLMMSTETEETRASSKTDDDLDEPPNSIEVTDKEESCTISPVSMATTKESSSETIKPVVGTTQVNTPQPKRSRTRKTPAADISVSSQESQFSTSQKTRKSFAEELAKKAGLTPNSTKSDDFSTSIARRAAEVQTPKKALTPLSASSSPPDDEPSPFLADYW